MHAATRAPGSKSFTRETWYVLPRFGSSVRLIDPTVPDPYRRDYEEATAILDVSPRMSAVLSRRLLADLLEEYAGPRVGVAMAFLGTEQLGPPTQVGRDAGRREWRPYDHGQRRVIFSRALSGLNVSGEYLEQLARLVAEAVPQDDRTISTVS